MPRIRLTDAYLRALPKAPGRDIWHSDTALLGFVAIQRTQGKITFRIRTDKNHSLKVGTWSATLTSSDARELAKAKLRDHLAHPACCGALHRLHDWVRFGSAQRNIPNLPPLAGRSVAIRGLKFRVSTVQFAPGSHETVGRAFTNPLDCVRF